MASTHAFPARFQAGSGRLHPVCQMTPPCFRRKKQGKDGGGCGLNSSGAARLRTRAGLEGAGPGEPSRSPQLGEPVAPPQTPVPPSRCSVMDSGMEEDITLPVTLSGCRCGPDFGVHGNWVGVPIDGGSLP